MAGTLLIADTEGEVALTAATAKTVMQITAPTNVRLKVLGWGIFFDGVSVTEQPVQVRLLRQTTAGTATSATPRRLRPSGASETIQSSASKDASAEPTAGDVLDVLEVHPQSGYEKQFILGQEIDMAGATRLGIEATAPAAVNCRAKIIYEE